MRHMTVLLLVLAIISAGCGDDGDEVSESTTTSIVTTTAGFEPEASTPTVTTPDGVLVIESGWYALDADTPYSSNPAKTPVLEFSLPGPAVEGSVWWAADSTACPPHLGSLILRRQRELSPGSGRMFIVTTSGVSVAGAVDAVTNENVIVEPTIGDTRIDGLSGSVVAGVLGDVGEGIDLGETLLPYHLVVEDTLDPPDGGPLKPGNTVEIHIADTGTGVLTVVLDTDPADMDAFRPDALAVADTIEIVATDQTGNEEC